jgi:antitoxin MazE
MVLNDMISYPINDIMEALMKVSKWGGSLAVRLPKELVETLKIGDGDEVALRPDSDGGILVSKIQDRFAFLDQLRTLRKELPKGYVWNRDEANERR